MRSSALASRLWQIAVILLFLLAVVPKVAADDYVLRSDDKLNIKIFQFPELSGDYIVSSNGTILIPPIGDVPAAGTTAVELSKTISSRLVKAGLSSKPGATVEVLQSRPIYVMGDVQKPGEYPYRHGLTALQAISLAGGWFRQTDPGLVRLGREAISLDGDLRYLVTRYYHLLAERSRLNAELALSEDMDIPAELKREVSGDPTLSQLLQRERALLHVNVEAVKERISSMQKTRDLYEQQIGAVTRQIDANKTQWDSVQKELATVKALMAKGLSPVTHQWNLERMEGQIEMTGQGFQSLILQARASIAQLDQKIFDLRSEHAAKVNKELQQTSMTLEEVSVKLDTSHKLMVDAEVQVQVGGRNIIGVSSTEIVDNRKLTVIRTRDGKAGTIDADESTEMLPGDVLKVEKGAIGGARVLKREVFGRELLAPIARKD